MFTEEKKQMLDDAPNKCFITGLEKCESYLIDGNVVYLPHPAYDAYTLPDYDPEDKSFSRIRYDMDDDFREEYEHVADLEDLAEHPNLAEIKRFYNID